MIITYINKASLIVTGVIFLNINIQAQKYPVVKTAEKGILVFPGQEFPKNTFYKIERSETGKNDFKTIAMLTSPKSFIEFKGLISVYSALITFNYEGDSAAISDVWKEFFKTHKAGKMKGLGNLPLMQAALGLLFYDTNVVSNLSYQYRVSFIKSAAESDPLISEPVCFPIKAATGKIKHYRTYSYDDHILIYWYIKDKNKPLYFDVYRQEVSKRNFIKIPAEKGFNNHDDTLFLIVNDKSVNKDENYNYYLLPSDYYGNKGDISETVKVSASSDNSLPVISKFEVGNSRKQDGLTLKWKFDRIKYLRSISIYRSNSFDDGYIKIAEVPSEDSIYTDRGVLQGKSYYYYLVINALNNKTTPSAKVSGFYSNDLKPFPPQVLKSENLTNGYKLSWQCIEENIQGFFVYRCEGIKGKMEQISEIVKKTDPRTEYFDTSSTLKRQSYSYAVKTVSKGFVESIFSDTVSVFPMVSKELPFTPSRVSARLYNNSILIMWDNMYKTNPYLAGYNVYRKEKKEKEYRLLNNEVVRNSQNSYIDTNITAGEEFSYIVESVDVFSNKSGKCNPVSVVLHSSEPVSASGIKLYNLGEGISISWDEVIQENLVSYKVYRYGEKDEPKLIHTSKPEERTYLDKDVIKDQLYIYYVTSQDKYGNESQQANEVSLRR